MANDNDLIAAIYDSIVDPSRWEEVVKRIVEATKSVAGGLYIRQAHAAELSATHNVDSFYATAFVETWHKHNPFDPLAAIIAPGELRSGTFITKTKSYRSSAFFNEYMRPQGWADHVGICLLRGAHFSGNLLVHRSPDAIWVEPAEWQLLETLAPH